MKIIYVGDHERVALYKYRKLFEKNKEYEVSDKIAEEILRDHPQDFVRKENKVIKKTKKKKEVMR